MARILFISHWYPNENRPTEGTFVREHALAVSQIHQVAVIAVRGVHRLSSPRIRISPQNDQGLSLYSLSYKKSLVPRTTWIHRWQGARQVVRQLIRNNLKPDIIHANVYSSADLAYALGREFRIPAVLTEHASSYPRRLLSPWQILQLRFYLPRLERVMPVSSDLIGHMQALGIRARYQPVPNTIDTEIFNPPAVSTSNAVPQVLMVASLNKIKNIDLALQALAALRPTLPVQLSIIGAGPERDHLEAHIRQLDLREQVEFLGSLPKEEVARRMQTADVLILSSLWENQPVVLLEAMACGLPVVAPRVGGIPEVVQDFCGRLFPTGDAAALAAGIRAVLENKTHYQPEKISAYTRDRFGYETVAREFTRIYDQLIETRP